jgi:hypothetical protein
VTGAGVTVAWIADGLDPTVAGFIRPNGSHVFVDYRDFSGDPAGTSTPGGEAFGDASSIAAQDVTFAPGMPNGKPLTFDISQFVNPAHPLPAPCPIRIRGMAPGASLVGLKVFSNLGYTTTSDFVQAIEWAVLHDHVNVINESFGGNPYPDNANDPISLFNDMAVKAGVTVVASTGDSGTAGTLGSPSTDPNVISAGATTQYRLYAQVGQGAIVLGSGGYISNNISSLSSGGFSQSGPYTPDVVAPGEDGWALCSTNPALFTDCISFAGTPTPIQAFGGTSESAPLTSGEAALIIQAYRSTHGGANPTPALVKQIITSTATDLGAPPYEQGAGLINSLKAVQAALSVQDTHGHPAGQGNGLLVTPTNAPVVALPGTRQVVSFTVTNTGNKLQYVLPHLQTLNFPTGGATTIVQLNPAVDPTFPNITGAPRAYVKQTFTVPDYSDRLDAAIAVPLKGNPNAIAYLSLFDPSGRLVAYSIPQGFGSGYGHIGVSHPDPGTWTAAIFVRPSGFGAYKGPIHFTWSTSRFVSSGLVFPPLLTLRPGQSVSAIAMINMPAQPGDVSAALRFTPFSSGIFPPQLNGTSPLGDVPLNLRALVPLGATGGGFTGTLTGGNGRTGGNAAAQTLTYAFDVPGGLRDISLDLSIPDNGYNLQGLLVDPNGMQLNVQSNITAVDPNTGSPTAYSNTLQFFRYNPQPGRWRFILLINFTASGNQTSLPFTAHIGFNAARITASGLPNSPSIRLPAGKPVTIPVAITNTGVATEQYFVDARLTTSAVLPLLALAPTSGTLPSFGLDFLPFVGTLFVVPTETSDVAFAAQSSVPINMDAFNNAGAPPAGITGSPDLFATPTSPAGTTVVASLSAPEVPFGPWGVSPSLIGPYGPAGAPTEPVATGAAALMQQFDAAVSSTSGNIWADLTLNTNTYNPLVLAPGHSGTINVTITPAASQVGKTVTGYLYVDTFNIVDGFAIPFSGDEVVRIPYSYTVAPAS